MKLYILRHFSTEASSKDVYSGATDIPLSEEGIRQAERFKAVAMRDNIFGNHLEVYTSPMKRTQETAKLLGFDDLFIDNRLKEIDHGNFEGLTKEEAYKQYPKYRDSYELMLQGYPSGESFHHVAARTYSLLDNFNIFRYGQGFNTLVDPDRLLISHKTTIKIITSILLKTPLLYARETFDCKPGSLAVFNISRDYPPQLLQYNVTLF